jgi:hypothetical protein
MDKRELPKGYVSVDEAVKIIKTNTFNEPTVNIKKMARKIDWVELNHNFVIPKVRLITKDEYMDKLKKFPGRKPSELVPMGNLTVTLRSSYDVELLKKTILDNFRETSGHEYNPKEVRGITTVIDQEAGGRANPRATKKTIAKEGDVIGAGATSTTNSADSAGV